MRGLHQHKEGYTTNCNPAVNGVTPKDSDSRQQFKAREFSKAFEAAKQRFKFGGGTASGNSYAGDMTRRNARRIARARATQAVRRTQN